MIRVTTFYHFATIDAPAEIVRRLMRLGQERGLRGIILVAQEGINATVAGGQDDVALLLEAVRALPGMAALEHKDSHAPAMPFGRLRVRLRPEIVTMGQPGVAPARAVGRHVPPQEWNALIAAPDVAVIDTRNSYETEIGTFEGAILPGIDSFREFPAWWAENRRALAGKRIAMFCTGGIRCEKSTSYLLGQGLNEVLHLRGGILKYLEDIPPERSLWRGECFVFDARVSVGQGLRPGTLGLCHACRRPVTPEAMQSPAYEQGVSCPACFDRHDAADRARFRERERQIALARARGAAHLGPEAAKDAFLRI